MELIPKEETLTALGLFRVVNAIIASKDRIGQARLTEIIDAANGEGAGRTVILAQVIPQTILGIIETRLEVINIIGTDLAESISLAIGGRTSDLLLAVVVSCLLRLDEVTRNVQLGWIQGEPVILTLPALRVALAVALRASSDCTAEIIVLLSIIKEITVQEDAFNAAVFLALVAKPSC